MASKIFAIDRAASCPMPNVPSLSAPFDEVLGRSFLRQTDQLEALSAHVCDNSRSGP
jgi:hypothetical protein